MALLIHLRRSHFARLATRLTLPPLIGATLFLTPLVVAAAESLEGLATMLGIAAIAYAYAFAICFIPGAAFHLFLEVIAQRKSRIGRPPGFVRYGALAGTLCGFSISLLFGSLKPEIVQIAIFSGIGLVAGTVTAIITKNEAS